VSRAPAPPPDPRPRIVHDGGEYRLEGVRCRNGHPLLARFHRCPRCGADVVPERFGPAGTVWSFTVMHVASSPAESVPYTIAYLDLEDGPRTLVRIAGAAPKVGDRARLVAPAPDGNAIAEVAA
jgi:uncharacterized protein